MWILCNSTSMSSPNVFRKIIRLWLMQKFPSYLLLRKLKYVKIQSVGQWQIFGWLCTSRGTNNWEGLEHFKLAVLSQIFTTYILIQLKFVSQHKIISDIFCACYFLLNYYVWFILMLFNNDSGIIDFMHVKKLYRKKRKSD